MKKNVLVILTIIISSFLLLSFHLSRAADAIYQPKDYKVLDVNSSEALIYLETTDGIKITGSYCDEGEIGNRSTKCIYSQGGGGSSGGQSGSNSGNNSSNQGGQSGGQSSGSQMPLSMSQNTAGTKTLVGINDLKAETNYYFTITITNKTDKKEYNLAPISFTTGSADQTGEIDFSAYEKELLQDSSSSSSNTNQTTTISLFQNPKLDFLVKLGSNKMFIIIDIILVILLIMLELFRFIKINRSWGLVFNSFTKQPIQGAVVRIFSEERNKILETKVTDSQGRFSFLTKTGSYFLEVVKEGFRFPSKLITKKNDEFFANMYRGEVVKIFRPNATLAPSIPIDPLGETSESLGNELKKNSQIFRKILFVLVNKIRSILLILLSLFHAGIILLSYTTPIFTIIILILLIWLVELYMIVAKGYR